MPVLRKAPDVGGNTMRVPVSILIIFLFGCQTRKADFAIPTNLEYIQYFPISPKDTLLEYQDFSIKVPNSWKQPNDDTLFLNNCKCAVSVGRIQIGPDEFINYSYGYGVQDVFDTSYSYQRPKGFVLQKMRNYHVSHDVKDSIKIKYFRPINIGTGYTGLFIDSIGNSKKVRFVMTGENLDSVTNSAFLKALNTIKYKFEAEW